jgi:hypothetical protein
MRLKTLIVILLLGLMGISVVSFAQAVPPTNTGPLDQMLTIVQNIQMQVNTVLFNLTTIQGTLDVIGANLSTLHTEVDAVSTDVSTIKTTTETINDKLVTPSEPIRYEYYTPIVDEDYLKEFFEYDEDYVTYKLGFTNFGESPANVSYAIYNTTYWEMTLFREGQGTLDGKHSTGYGEILRGNKTNPPTPITIKITSDSEFVAPTVYIQDHWGNVVEQYLPGDFLKVEIYE